MDEAQFISTDANGTMRVAGGRISLDSVVIAFQQGLSPEEIQRDFPSLTLEHVYAAITYYLGHRTQVDDYLGQMKRVWEKSRAESEAHLPASVTRLRRARASHTGSVP